VNFFILPLSSSVFYLNEVYMYSDMWDTHTLIMCGGCRALTFEGT